MAAIEMKPDKSDIPLTSNALFSTPEGATWKDLTIRFTNGHTVSVDVLGTRGVFNFAEMGMSDKRNGEPNFQWRLLLELSVHRGELSWSSESANPANKKRCHRLRAALRDFFGISDQPIEWDGSCYRTSFRVIPDPAWEEESIRSGGTITTSPGTFRSD